MNKYVWIGGLLAALAIGGSLYYFFVYEPPARYRPVAERPTPPVYTSLSGITLNHPEATSTTATLSQVYASSQADFPAGRFELTGSTTETGLLIAFDRFAHEGDDGLFAVPIGVYDDDTRDTEYYLAVLEGEERRHTSSFAVGENISLETVEREGDRVTVKYKTFDRAQLRTDAPRLQTEAVFNIADNTIVKVGANVLMEQEVEVERIPGGMYEWQYTTTAAGDEIAPPNPEQFQVFVEGGRFRITTDCNTATAPYNLEAGKLVTVSSINATKKFCESELDQPLFDMFEGINSFDYKEGRLTLLGVDTIELIDPTKVVEEEVELATTTASGTQAVGS